MELMGADIVIVGAGIAGLSTALYLQEFCPDLTIQILDKSEGLNSNTNFAQGGIAAVVDQASDTFEYHFQDTMKAGRYISKPEIVSTVVTGAPRVVDDLVSWGVDFDRDECRKLKLALEGGHSNPRIVHHKDSTGAQIHQVLRKKVAECTKIGFFKYHLATDIWMDAGECSGIWVFHPGTGTVFNLFARFLILGTGGSGQVFETTSNPNSATGDGLAMAIRAGAEVEGLEYYQFHPTSLYSPGSATNLLITEALRGAGAYVLNHRGERFLLGKDAGGELATRDKVTSHIYGEMQQTQKDHVYLDARHLGPDILRNQFPTVYDRCLQAGFDLAIELVPIVPAAHYQCGGIKVDHHASTSIPNLFAVGECAHTGLHGTNRLASNSLPEAMVFAKNLAIHVKEQEAKAVNRSGFTHSRKQVFEPGNLPMDKEEIQKRRKEIKGFMSAAFLENKPIKSVEAQLHSLEEESIWVETNISQGFFNELVMDYRNLLTVSQAMLKAKYLT